MINRAAHLQYVPLETTKRHVNVLPVLMATLTDNVAKVSITFLFLRNTQTRTKVTLKTKVYNFYKIGQISVKRGECEHDTECPDNNACIDNQCLDPCSLSEPCGKQAICETTSHRPVCRCPQNWAGNPHEECYQCRFSITNISILSF